MRIFTFLIFLSTSILSTHTIAQQVYFPDQLIIKFNETSTVDSFKAKSSIASLLSEHKVSDFIPLIDVDIYNGRTKVGTQLNDVLSPLSKIYQVHFESTIDALELAAVLSNNPDIEYAEPRYIYSTREIITNDPIKNNFLSVHKFDEAWEIEQGSEDIIIGIVDSGVNYFHEDLKNKQWINEDEIPNNGIDDDGNGFIDDYLGWDFWESGYSTNSVTSDNNPNAEHSDHGTHVAGIATAEANNGVGLAGSGFNSKYMAVKAGGVEDNPSTPDTDESRSIGFGYEGILYAYINGADIINCSWGGFGSSAFGQDIVRTVTEGGSLVVAAAGNENVDQISYPAGYEQVLSVGAMETNGVKTSYSNYGSTVDVFATGSVFSSNGHGTNDYALYGGTSMASPVVAGLAALLKSQHPNWTPERLFYQIAGTAVSIEDVNQGFAENSFGKGSINAKAALERAIPILRLDSLAFVNENGTELDLNQRGTASIYVTNIGGPTEELLVQPSVSNVNLNFESTSANIGALSTGQSTVINFPVSLDVDFNRTLSSEVILTLSDTPLNYSDELRFEYNEMQFKNLEANNVAMSFTPTGKIGFYDAFSRNGGVGFVPNADTANFLRDNILYEGGVILEANGKMVNNIRSESGESSEDFLPIESYKITSTTNGLEGKTIFRPQNTTGLAEMKITLTTTAYTSLGLQNSVLLQYSIENTSATKSLSDVFLGIFNDWDIGNAALNSANYLLDEDIQFISEDGATNSPVVSVVPFGQASSVLAIDNSFEGPFSRTQFGLNDDFTRTEKRNSLQAGKDFAEVSTADVSTVVASGPYYIAPNSSAKISFIYAYGNTLQELVTQIETARAITTVEQNALNNNPDLGFPSSTTLLQNYPNPFNPNTNVQFRLSSSSSVTLSVYDILGRKVMTVVEGNLTAGIHTYALNFNAYASGLYFAELITNDQREIIKLNLLK